MIPRLLLAVVLIFGSILLAQGEKPILSETVQLKARVLQLEAQLSQSQQQNALCDARLVMASAPQVQQQQAKDRAALEQQANCPIDWTANPPICKATDAKPLAKKEH